MKYTKVESNVRLLIFFFFNGSYVRFKIDKSGMKSFRFWSYFEEAIRKQNLEPLLQKQLRWEIKKVEKLEVALAKL